MKHTVLDILIYIFEQCMDDDVDLVVDRDSLRSDLRQAGFEDAQVVKAFDWLEGLAEEPQEGFEAAREAAGGAIRVYTAEEQEKLDVEGRGLLHFLEQVGVLDARNRELVVDRVMALESDDIDIEQLKWIVLMVLFNQPGQEDSFLWMEDVVMDESRGCLH